MKTLSEKEKFSPSRLIALLLKKMTLYAPVAKVIWKLCRLGRKRSWFFSSNQIGTFPGLNSLLFVIQCFQSRYIFKMFVSSTFSHIDAFWRLLQQTSFENIVTIGDIAQNKQFLLLPQCFHIFIVFYIIVVWGKGLKQNCLIIHMYCFIFWHCLSFVKSYVSTLKRFNHEIAILYYAWEKSE